MPRWMSRVQVPSFAYPKRLIIDKKTEKLENSAEKLTVTLDKDDLQKSYDDLLRHYAKEAVVKGFRKGKTPISVIESRFGDAVKSETVMKAIDETWKELLDAKEIAPLPYAEPKLADEESLKPEWSGNFTFSVTYDVEPKITLPDYRNIEVELPAVAVEEADIQKELAQIQDQNAVITAKKSGGVEKNDIVTIDYSLLDENGEVMPKTEREDFVFTVGSGYNLYKLDDDIIGMNKGDEKIVKKSFGEEENAPSEKFKTLDDLKADIKERLQKAVDTKLKAAKVEAALNQIAEKTVFELPQSMIAAEQDQAWQNFLAQNNLQEAQAVQILKYQGKTKEDVVGDFKEAAVKNAKDRLILKALTEAEKLDVTDADYEIRFEEIAKASGKTAEEIKKVYDNPSFKAYMAEEILTGKAVDFLAGAAKVRAGKKTSAGDFLSM